MDNCLVVWCRVLEATPEQCKILLSAFYPEDEQINELEEKDARIAELERQLDAATGHHQ